MHANGKSLYSWEKIPILMFCSYLLEIKAFLDLEELIEVNRMAVDTLPPDSRVINLRGSLTSHLGQLLLQVGKPAEGVEWLRKSYEIRSKDVPFKPRESAWAAGNLADGLAANNNFPEAIKWHEKAHDHWLEWSNVHTSSPGSWPIGLKNSMAMNLIWAGPSEYKRARETIMQSKHEIDSTEPFDWGFGAQ